MSSLFSCLGKKSKSKKKKTGKPPEPKLAVDPPKEVENKERSIEEDIPADKINGHLNNEEEEECKETVPVECEEDSQQVTLIKELKSKLSIKLDHGQNEAETKENNKDTDDVKLSDKTADDKQVHPTSDVEQKESTSGITTEPEREMEDKTECTEIIEKSVIQSVEAEVVKLEAKSKESEKHTLSKSESISETNLKQTNHLLSEHNLQLKKNCDEKEKYIVNQKEEISNLQKDISSLKATINNHDKLQEAIKERQDIMDTVKQLTDVCSSLKLRLDEFENEKEATKMTSSLEIESKFTSVDTDHREININIQNTLRSVQELECRVISLELDKENDQGNCDEMMLNIKHIENDKSKLQENLNEVLKREQEQRNKVSSLESQLGSLNNQISELKIENKNIKDLLDESTKSNHTKDEKLSSMQKTENSLQNTIRNLESKIEHYEARHKSETEEISVSKKRLEKLEGQLREKEIAHQETIRKLAEVQNKQEDLQKRLSVVSSEKVTVNSIPAQPMSSEDNSIKIGEKFRELYSTVWCEGYEKLHTVCRRDERKVLLILMEYLTECYLYCRRTARHQMDALLSLLASPTNMRGSLNKRLQGKNGQIENIPTALKQNIMAFRRTPSENFTESIFEEFMNQVDYQKSRHLRNIQARDITEVTPFVRKCIGVCWEMVTQEPPMYLLFKLRHNQIIEKDKFDIYSGDGNKVDFLVWPALLRDENGRLLQKGVVQAIRS